MPSTGAPYLETEVPAADQSSNFGIRRTISSNRASARRACPDTRREPCAQASVRPHRRASVSRPRRCSADLRPGFGLYARHRPRCAPAISHGRPSATTNASDRTRLVRPDMAQATRLVRVRKKQHLGFRLVAIPHVWTLRFWRVGRQAPENGNAGGALVCRRILAAIEELQRGRREGEVVN